MGNWQLEVVKMAIYITFPVAMFHYFNQPENFEETIRNINLRINTPEEDKFREEYRALVKRKQEEEEVRILKKLDEKENL